MQKYSAYIRMSDDFRQELRSQFDRLGQVKERLDNKANNIMAMSGTIATLFMGFGIFLLTDIKSPNPALMALSILSLLLEVVFTTFAIKHSTDAHKLKAFYYPLGYQFFMKDQDEFDEEKIEKFQTAGQDKLDTYFCRGISEGD